MMYLTKIKSYEGVLARVLLESNEDLRKGTGISVIN